MFVLFLVLCFSDENRTACSEPNSTWDEDSGRCVCENGYVTTPEQFGEFGCWKCDTLCHAWAQCVHPGKCQCLPQFVGDGVDVCTNPVPTVLDHYTRMVMANGSSLLTFSFKKDTGFSPTQMFCQVGTTIVTGTITKIEGDGGEVTCTVPRTMNGEFHVSLSFDSFHWSATSARVLLEVMDNVEEIEKAKPFLITLTVLIFIGICVNYGNSLFFTLPDEENCL